MDPQTKNTPAPVAIGGAALKAAKILGRLEGRDPYLTVRRLVDAHAKNRSLHRALGIFGFLRPVPRHYIVEVSAGRAISFTPEHVEAFESYCLELGTAVAIRGQRGKPNVFYKAVRKGREDNNASRRAAGMT